MYIRSSEQAGPARSRLTNVDDARTFAAAIAAPLQLEEAEKLRTELDTLRAENAVLSAQVLSLRQHVAQAAEQLIHGRDCLSQVRDMVLTNADTEI